MPAFELEGSDRVTISRSLAEDVAVKKFEEQLLKDPNCARCQSLSDMNKIVDVSNYLGM